MKFILKPSLEHIILVKVVVALWSQNGVKNIIKEYRSSRVNENQAWREIEKRVMEKVLHLPLPKLLKEKASGFIKPIGLEIFEWIRYHCIYHHLLLNLASSSLEFYWTPQGTIDRKKTAKMIIKDDSFDIHMRYTLACLYCFEDDVLELQDKIPDLEKVLQTKPLQTKYITDQAILHQNKMIHHWSYSNRNKQNIAYYSYIFEFEACVLDGNKEATYYFLQKLTPTERNHCLIRPRIDDVHFYTFLLSQMNEEQETAFFKNQPSIVSSFLDWPFQSFFMEMVNHVMDFLHRQHILEIVKCFKKKSDFEDYNYKRLFGNFLQICSNDIKSDVLFSFIHSCDSSSLFLIKDKENLKLLLQDAPLRKKKNFIYSKNGKEICRVCISEEEWALLEYFIQECLPANEEMMEFKKKFEEDPLICAHFTGNKYKWDQLFSLNKKSVCNHNDREFDADEGNLSKRIRYTQE